MELDLAGMHQLAAGQGIDPETLDAALSEALRLAYLKTPHAAKHARVELDPRAGSFTVWAQDEIPGEPTEDDPHPAPTLGEEYDDTPHDFGRLAAATARQVISQLFRKAEDDKVFGAFSGQKGKLITGIVQQDVKDTSNVHVAVGDVEALLPRREQVPGERYRHGERIRVYVVNVARGLKGPEIVVSRSHPELVRKLFEREVPELVSGAVSIMAIAREAGARTKIAVKANTEAFDWGRRLAHDPVGVTALASPPPAPAPLALDALIAARSAHLRAYQNEALASRYRAALDRIARLSPDEALLRSVAEAYARELKTTFATLKQYQQNVYYNGQWRPEYDRWVGMLAGLYAGPGRERVAWNQALTSEMVFTQPVVHEFAQLRVPTTLFIGLKDRTAIGKGKAPPQIRATLGNYPVLGKRAAAAIPGAKLIEFDDLGHSPQVQDPARFNAALLKAVAP